mmetsp:Transcript_16018/g.40699  ORF Transcript_16018/g.40699 Transcript_16018/m.40699 type:complete len:86 (+) Transcript_16018:530-787(+)
MMEFSWRFFVPLPDGFENVVDFSLKAPLFCRTGLNCGEWLTCKGVAHPWSFSMLRRRLKSVTLFSRCSAALWMRGFCVGARNSVG